MDATRHEILRHSEDLFAHYGFAKTNMADIAARCGMSPGNLYRYYRNKHAIGIAVVEAFFRQAEAGMAAALTGLADPEQRIRALLSSGVAGIVAEMARTPKIMELVEFITDEADAYAVLKGHIGWKRDRIIADLHAGMAAGLFSAGDAHQTAVNIMHATKAFQMPQSLAAWKEPETILPELAGVLDLVFQGVRRN